MTVLTSTPRSPKPKVDELGADLFKGTFDPVEKAWRDAQMAEGQIPNIVLIGGSTKIPKIQMLLTETSTAKS